LQKVVSPFLSVQNIIHHIDPAAAAAAAPGATAAAAAAAAGAAAMSKQKKQRGFVPFTQTVPNLSRLQCEPWRKQKPKRVKNLAGTPHMHFGFLVVVVVVNAAAQACSLLCL
jgi:hypothetical protein